MARNGNGKKTYSITRKIENYLNKYFYFKNPTDSFVCALWILTTWMFHDEYPMQPWVIGYMYVNSVLPESGKTTLMKLCYPLTLNPEKGARITSAAMYEMLDKEPFTIFLDELDTIFDGTKRNEDLRGVVNAGYEHGGYIIKMGPIYDEEGNKLGQGPRRYNCFGSKMLAGIDNKKLDGTIRSRCITINLEPKPEDVKREKYFPHRVGPEAEALAEDISEWVLSNGKKISGYDPPEREFDNREYEITFALLQIAHADGRETEARKVLKQSVQGPQKQAPEHIVYLRKIHAVFQAAGTDKIESSTLIAAVGLPEQGGGRLLSSVLSPLGITRDLFRLNGKPVRGYRREAFSEAFSEHGIGKEDEEDGRK